MGASVLLVIVVVIAGSDVAAPYVHATVNARSKKHRPNVLFVLADDLDLAEMQYMPMTRRLIGGRGATFDNYFVTDSLCCPSRTTTLRGQYPHNTGVRSNGGSNGGFEAALRLGVERDTYATRLQQVGYANAFFGKYLNHYPGIAGESYIPPGWASWASPSRGHPYSEYDYTLNVDGNQEEHDRLPRDYGTTVYFGMAEQFVTQSAQVKQPFYVAVNVYAPHTPSIPAPRDTGLFPTATAPRTPAFDLADVTGKPAFVRDLPQFTPDETAAIDRLYRRRLRSLQAVDRGVASMVATLRRTHELSKTYIVFASDNGFHLGENRLPAGKETAYDTDIHVPLLVRGPGIEAGRHIGQFALNNDLAPTFEAMVGVRPAPFTDGRSLLPLLHGSQPRATRRALLVEHWPETGPNGQPRATNHDGKELEEPQDPDQFDPRLHPDVISGPNPLRDHTILGRLRIIPEYAAVRTSRYLYVEYINGDRERYDLRADPDEVHNLFGTKPKLDRKLAQRLAALRLCRAATCRRAEDRRRP